MRKTLFTILLFGMIPLAASAAMFVGHNSVFVETGKTVSSVYFASGGTLDLGGTFENDVIVAGGNITISGPVKGDVLAAGGNVKVTGEVQGNVRIAGGTLDFDSKVGKNVILAGGSITLGSKSEIGGELLLLGSHANVSGHIVKGIDGWLDSLNLDAKVDGGVDVRFNPESSNNTASAFIVGPSTVIGGDLTYHASQDAVIRPGATIKGTVTKAAPVAPEAGAAAALKGLFALGAIWQLFSLLVVAVLVSLVFPKTLRAVAETMTSRTGVSIGIGALFLFALPIAAIIMMFTVIGVALSLITLALYAIALYSSQIFLGYLVGEKVLQRFVRPAPQQTEIKPRSPIWATLLGIVVVSLVLDFLFVLIVRSAGFGFGVIIGVIRLFLLIWPFGALLMVKWRLIREREQ